MKKQRRTYVCEKTPLYAAVEDADEECVKLLLANDGININATSTVEKIERSGIKTINVETAFYYAVEEGDKDIIKLFLENKKLDVNCMNHIQKKNEGTNSIIFGCRKRKYWSN